MEEVKRKWIYLDNNSTTPIDKRVLDSMMPFLTNSFANANSTHQFGIDSNKAIKIARQQVATLIGAESHEMIFTSGATEAINLALKGVVEQYFVKGNHIITVATEHAAVLDTCHYLERCGYEITYLSVKPNGLIDLNELKAALRADTVLTTVMYVNNETGVIQPIKEIAQLTHEVGALFICDGTQAIGKIPVDVEALGIDLLAFSGHKFYAPKGVGALYIKKGIRLPPMIHGGGHERGLRSGTLNVPGIIALGAASELAQKEMRYDAMRVGDLRDRLEQQLLQLPRAYVNGNTENRLYNVTNICFPGEDANVIIGRLKTIAVSNGSACTAAIIEPSHVLQAMGLTDDDAYASIRFSLGKFNTAEDIMTTAEELKAIIQPNQN
ncbi:MAG: cysteine desulfurase family protein [Taibaiella sp.]|jgi:cysteine desulfurase